MLKVNLPEPVEKSEDFVTKIECPRCKQQTCLTTNFPDVPLRFKILFVWVTLSLNINAEYCPNCGFFRIKLA